MKKNKRNFLDILEISFFFIGAILMSSTTENYAFTLPIYCAYAFALIRNLVLYAKSKSPLPIYKILLYSVIIPDNYIVIPVLAVSALCSAVKNKALLQLKERKKILFLILLLFLANIAINDVRPVNFLFSLFYGIAFPCAYIFWKTQKDGLKKHYKGIILFIKELVLVEIVSVLVYLLVNTTHAISGIDNDWLSGTFGLFHGNLLLFFMIFAILVLARDYESSKNKQNIVLIAILALLSIFTNSVALTVLFLLSYLTIILFKARNIKTVFKNIAIIAFAGLLFFFGASQQWMRDYMVNLTDLNYIKKHIPKTLVYKDTFYNIPSKDLRFLLIGNGAGQYSSRAALICTGYYINEYNKIFSPSISEYTDKYILNKYKKYNIEMQHGTMYSPYSSVISIFGEYGIVGLGLFIFRLNFLYQFGRLLSFVGSVKSDAIRIKYLQTQFFIP